MPVLPLEQAIIYGPVFSRRLGVSLGVNLLPTQYKACSFDCVYCHYGRTPRPALTVPAGDIPWPAEVMRALERALRLSGGIDSITFSGNGEPTLHPAFAEIVASARRLRDRLCPHTQLALFSNASTVAWNHVLGALCLFDAAMMKLDAGDPRTFRAMNRPVEGVDLSSIVSGLRGAGPIQVQSVLVGGRVSNTSPHALARWMDVLEFIRPERVVIYSTDYPVAEAGVERMAPFELAGIAEELARRTGLQADARWVLS
jgi:wyosine [tRNA(Phe)-imidazoG37] synthetase (radical SAM superfamily)